MVNKVLSCIIFSHKVCDNALIVFFVDSLWWKSFYVTGCLFVALQNMEEWEVRSAYVGYTLMPISITIVYAVLITDVDKAVIREHQLGQGCLTQAWGPQLAHGVILFGP